MAIQALPPTINRPPAITIAFTSTGSVRQMLRATARKPRGGASGFGTRSTLSAGAAEAFASNVMPQWQAGARHGTRRPQDEHCHV